MSKVPRVVGLDFQCTISVPLPNKSELIFDCGDPNGLYRDHVTEDFSEGFSERWFDDGIWEVMMVWRKRIRAFSTASSVSLELI